MNGISIRELVIEWVTAFVFIQGSLVVCLACMTVLLLLWRKYYQRKLLRFKADYSDQLVQELIQNMDGTGSPVIDRKKRLSVVRIKALRTAILEQAQSLSGFERKFLIQRHHELGLTNDAVGMTKSRKWWKRLEGVSELALLATPDHLPIFLKLKTDENDLVAAHAVYAVSLVTEDLNQIKIKDFKRVLECGREGLIKSIASNLCRAAGFRPVLNFALACKEEEIQEALLLAVLTVKSPEVGEELRDLLSRTEGRLTPKLLAPILETLREIADPDSIDIAERHYQHPNSIVREKALHLGLVVATEPLSIVERFREDPSPTIRRLLMSVTESRAA